MTKHCIVALVLALIFGLGTPTVSAQAVAAATGRSLSLGVSYQNIDPDYGPSRSSGAQVFANYDISRVLGLVAEANFATAFSNVVFLEHSYLVGGRGLYRRGRYIVYGKALIGAASSSNNSTNPLLLNAGATYPVLGLGGGLDAEISRRIVLRAIDYEDQHWFSYNPNSLTPHMFSIGAAYRFGE